ncbi:MULTISPECIES: anticodon nuclease [Alphaproteobacteria]|uniref:anticodon nuclease n=1 Tax=Sphingopyxis sp. TaxID=1908224 RepID=UPI0040339DEA
MTPADPFPDLPALAAHLREVLDPALGNKKCVLLYAYNGTGKTRLSMDFKNAGKAGDERDTLYFNAFTEDLFSWDNDLDGDIDRKLRLNAASRFFAGLDQLEMDNRIRPLLQRYTDLDFRIDTAEWIVSFSREVHSTDDQGNPTTVMLDNIKVSRGEENIFIWCFFLAIAELAIEEAEAYAWVKYLYIDDPISSLDEHNAINVACHVAKVLKDQDRVRAVISTHHTLFFNVLCNELARANKRFLTKATDGGYLVRETGDTPFFHHVAVLAELQKAAESGELYTYHFNMLRAVLEKTSSFHGFKGFTALINREDDDPDGILHGRLLNVMTHGNYSLYEPVEMVPENKEYFRRILANLRRQYTFNPDLFEDTQQAAA